MGASRNILCSSTFQSLKTVITQPPLRSLSTTTATTDSSHHNDHQRNHQFLGPDVYLNSWKPPKEAEAKLQKLQREYAKKVKEVRKEYIQEMELQRLEKQRKEEAMKEALRIANKERKVAKAAAKKAKAAQRQMAEEEFRQSLLKERADKLDYWRMKEKQVEEKTKEKNELLRRQSSMWIDENELEKKIVDAIDDTTSL
ncbi:hypothetical protein LguiA_034490 [Lonicera macranthoides]